MPTTPMFPSSVSLAPGIYVDEIDTGVKHLPAVTRELLRISLEQVCERELAWLVNEQDTPKTRMHLLGNRRGHLDMRWVKNELKGQSPDEGFLSVAIPLP